MTIRRRVRRAAKAVVFAARANPFASAAALRRIVERDAIAILNFHRVGRPGGSSYVPLDPVLFDDILRFCRSNGRCLTFSDLNEAPPSASPIFIISFDDGYLDFAEQALPLLRRHGIRCNHNFIPGAVESGRPPLNVYIQDFIGKAPDALLAEVPLARFGPLPPRSDRERFGTALSSAFKRLPIARQRAEMEVLQPFIDRFDRFEATPMMRFADLRSVQDEVEIGAHSFDHATLSAESEEYVRDDARRCRSWFQQKLGLSPEIYALPNGAASDRQRDILREEGYSTILRVEELHSRRGSREHTRFTIYGDSAAEVRSRALGMA